MPDYSANGFDELADMFRKFYGLEQLPHDSPDYAKAWEKASENYKTSLNEWLEFMSVVPKKKYLALEKKYDTLRKKVASQDETIRRLQNLLSEKGVSHMDAVQSFTEMVEKPAPEKAPSNYIISGRYILQPEIFAEIEAQDAGAGGEIQITDAMIRLMARQSFYGVKFDGDTYDCGNKVGFLMANVAYGLDRPDIEPEFRQALTALLNG